MWKIRNYLINYFQQQNIIQGLKYLKGNKVYSTPEVRCSVLLSQLLKGTYRVTKNSLGICWFENPCINGICYEKFKLDSLCNKNLEDKKHIILKSLNCKTVYDLFTDDIKIMLSDLF